MIQELWEQIQDGQEVRQNLSKIRQEIKGNGERRKLSSLLGQGDGPYQPAAVGRCQDQEECSAADGGFEESVVFGAYLEGISGGWAEVC